MQVSKFKSQLMSCALSLMMTLSAGAAITAPTAADAQQIIRVGNDRGGLVGARATEIRQIATSGSRVEIVGNICYSSCTMYLGAGNVCVRPETVFGFHGPSSLRGTLAPDRFEHWSNVMARHYKEPIRTWFMQKARYKSTNGYLSISGSQLINVGYERC